MKELPLYGRKNFEFKALDFDEGSRKVAGYFSTFNVVDSDMDMIVKGAFAKSISEAGPQSAGNRKIQHLRNHDWNWQIGRLLELKEDETGLFFVSQMGRSTAGTDAFLDYQDMIIKEHSIGFNYVPDKIRWVDGTDGSKGYYLVTEVKLWEGSAVTFGANKDTPVISVAKGTAADYIAKLDARAKVLAKVLKEGKGSDERFANIEASLLSLCQEYADLARAASDNSKSLEKTQPSTDTAKEVEPKVKDFYLHL